MDKHLQSFIAGLPKCELHLHLEGSFEPEHMFEMARRNQVEIPYSSIEELKKAYQFANLQEFLDIYYAGAQVLLHEADFEELTWRYMQRVHAENTRHVEVFFDPQTHTDRGVAFATAIGGILKGLERARTELGMSASLIMSFLRHLSEKAAFATLEKARPWRAHILGVGLDSSELGNPPSKFERVFAKAREEGYLLMAHAGEEGPADYIREALDLLKVHRIDHGNRCMDDDLLVAELSRKQVPLTLCPLSNEKLQVCPDLSKHPLKNMIKVNLLVSIHSDDPAYFGGYMNANYLAMAEALDLNKDEIIDLAKNAFRSSFLEEAQKEEYLAEVEAYARRFSEKGMSV